MSGNPRRFDGAQRGGRSGNRGRANQLVFDPTGERHRAKKHTLLQQHRIALPELALLDADAADHLVQRAAPSRFFNGANTIRRDFIPRVEHNLKLGNAHPMARHNALRVRLHDDSGDRSGAAGGQRGDGEQQQRVYTPVHR